MYPANDRFAYARGCFMVFPKEFMEKRGFTGCDVHFEDDYGIYFKPNTPDEIKQRVIKEYAEYHKEYMDKFLGRTV